MRSSPAHPPASGANLRGCSRATVIGWCWRRAARPAGRRSPMRSRARGRSASAGAGDRSRAARMPATASTRRLPANGLEPQFVVNNAGFGLVGAAESRDRAEQLAMIDLNVRTLTDFSLRWVEPMTRHRGGLLNVASVAGFLPGSGLGGLLRQQGLCGVVHRGAASGMEEPRRCGSPPCVRGRCRPNFRHAPASSNAESPPLLEVSADSGRGGGLSRADGRAPAGGAGLPQQAHRGAVRRSCRASSCSAGVERQQRRRTLR